jgi:hypothetical protein
MSASIATLETKLTAQIDAVKADIEKTPGHLSQRPNATNTNAAMADVC